MALFKSGNPALSEKTFKGFQLVDNDSEVMTLQGTVNKTALLLLLCIVPAMFTWALYTLTYDFMIILPFWGIATVGGIVITIIMINKKELAPTLAPIYAVIQGLFLGGISAALDARFPGIALQALILTLGICGVMLLIYKLKIIKPTENFKLIIASATGGIALFYLISIGMSFLGVQIPLVNENTTGGIIFSLFVVVLAAMNLVVDFDFIEQGANSRAPKYMEWYGAFGLMVTIIWLYVEILRLLAKSRRR
jgi:uncharacterized YccA/Bax inhibitor family protein